MFYSLLKYFSLNSKAFIFLIFGILIHSPAVAQNEIKDPTKDFLSKIGSDMSQDSKIFKIVYDFNGDGIKDIGLSCSDTWGNAGGEWHFYSRNSNHNYSFYDSIETLHSVAYSIIKHTGEPNVIVFYQKLNCCSGSLSYLSITPKGFKLIKNTRIGDNETLDADEVSIMVNEELSKGQKGIETSAEVKCLIKNLKSCWQ